VIAIDRDRTAIAGGFELVAASDRSSDVGRGSFLQSHRCLCRPRRAEDVNGVVMDVGVSSMQIDQAERGFSFRFDGPLDMRMGQHGPTAADVVAKASEGRSRQHHLSLRRRAALALCSRARSSRRARKRRSTTTKQLVDIVAEGRVVPSPAIFIRRRARSRRCASSSMRSSTNSTARSPPPSVCSSRAVGSSVVSFHSLEDRIVKNFIDRTQQDRWRITASARSCAIPCRASQLV
jgi:16S rRNA (cytosine1402-N4)-methyltransferase